MLAVWYFGTWIRINDTKDSFFSKGQELPIDQDWVLDDEFFSKAGYFFLPCRLFDIGEQIIGLVEWRLWFSLVSVLNLISSFIINWVVKPSYLYEKDHEGFWTF